jgi:hypothetical protein
MLWVAVDDYYEKWDEQGIVQVRTNELPEGDIAYSPTEFWRQLAKMHMADFRLALLSNGFLEQVETAMENPEMPRDAKILWEYSTTVHRNDPILNQVKAQLGFTDEDLDLVFGVNLL